MVTEQECLFCKIIKGEIPSKKLYDDATIFAFLDINPRNPGHTLVIPKRHSETIFDMNEKEVGKLFETTRRIAAAVKKGVNADGISITQSNGKAAGQVVAHAHVHIIPRFNTEGPIGLEGVLPVKKMPPEMLDKLVTEITKHFGAAKGSDEPKYEF